MEYANRDDAVKKREFRPSLRGKLPSVKTNRNNSFPRKKLRHLHQGWALFLGTSEEQFILRKEAGGASHQRLLRRLMSSKQPMAARRRLG